MRDMVALLAVSCLGSPSGTDAAEFRAAVSASTYGEYNDNPRLAPQDPDSVVGLVASAGAEMDWQEQGWRWSLAPRLVARQYSGDDSLDSNDVFLAGSYSRSRERGEVEVTAAYAREYTLTSEFAATGVVDTNVPRTSTSAQAAGTYLSAPRASISGRLSYEDVAYEQGLRYGLFDYQYAAAVGVFQWTVNPRTRLGLVGRLARLEVPRTDGGSREMSAGLSVDHALSQSWRAAAAIGPSRADFRVGDSVNGYSYRASLEQETPNSVLELTAERLLSPSAGQGRLQTRDAARGSYLRRIRESLDISAFAAAEYYRDVGERIEGLRGRTGSVRGGVAIDWRPSQQWSWRASYAYTVVDTYDRLRDPAGTPRGNQLLVGLTWNGRQRSVSL